MTTVGVWPVTHPTPKPRARKTSPSVWGSRLVRNSRTVGRGRKARWWHARVGFGASHPRPPDEGHPRLPGADWLSFPRSSTRALGGFVMFGPSESEPALSHPRPRETHGTRQGRVRQAFAVTLPPWKAGRPRHDCGSNASGSRLCNGFRCATLEPVPAFSPEALAAIHLDPAGPRTSAGVFASQAAGPRVRPPRARTHRLPPARAP